MRASIKWLKDYVEFNEEPQQLADNLTMAGVPVATVEYLGKGIDKVITGEILEIERHPDADKLSICKVNVGAEVLTIVTGATNVSQGNIVPVAVVGAQLPSGMSIQPTKLRGVMSYGMLCSVTELGIDPKTVSTEQREGIYLLPAGTTIGTDIRQILGLDDVVLEFELTANRADCFSVIGLAREIAVLTNSTLKRPMLRVKELAEDTIGNQVQIAIEEPELCSRFAARLLKDVKVAESPEWLKQRLQAAGMRPINNVVDVTNFVMLEMGQPMHAYDYNLLSRHSLIVRRAGVGEKITTLDGVKRTLTTDMLVIADAVQAVGIAGVMGGLATEVTGSTQNVLLEAASFNGVSIRRTSRALGLRSEASGRFERGVDTANIVQALDRAAQLLQEMSACTVCQDIVDNYPQLRLPEQVSFEPQSVNSHLGTNISQETMVDILKRLGFTVDVNGSVVTTVVPTWRSDVTGMADIAEEVARIYGYNNILSTSPYGKMDQGMQSGIQTVADRLRDILTALGFDEVINFSFSHPATLDKLNVPADSQLRRAVPVLNPITDELPILRTTLLSSIMDTIEYNFNRKNDDVRIYEVGMVFLPGQLPIEALPQEAMMLCGALTGRRQEVSWNQSRELVDFYDAKGAVEEILAVFGINDYMVAAGQHYAMHPGKTAVFSTSGTLLATVGEIHPEVLAAFGINKKIYAFEINVVALAEQSILKKTYKSLPKFPAIQRDLAVILDENISSALVLKAIEDSAGSLLETARLFDVYTGEQVNHGLRSLAFSLTFRTPDRTLTDAEVDTHYNNIVTYLDKQFAAKLRS